MNSENKNNKIGPESKINDYTKINDVILKKDVNPFIMNALNAR